MKRWVAAGFAIAGAQLALTIAFPHQAWSMQTGMACLAALCAVATLRSAAGEASWRHRVVAAGFAAWSLMWAAFVVQDSLLNSEQSLAILPVVVRYVCFIIVLLPVARQIESLPLRLLDGAQGLLFAVVQVMLILPGILWIPIFTYNNNFMYLSYVTMALLALVSVVTQPQGSSNLGRALLATVVVYGVASTISISAAERYSIDRNAPIWIFGDSVYLVYLAMLAIDRTPLGGMVVPVVRASARYHLAPLMLATLVMLLALELGHAQPLVGVFAGLCTLLIYAARSTLLESYYHRAQDRIIAVERDRSQNMIEMVHEVRGALGGVVMNVATLKLAEDLPTVQSQAVDALDRGCARTITLLRDLLDLERLEANQAIADTTSIDVVPVIHDALADVAAQATQLGIALSAPDRESTLVATGNGAALSRVLLNLLQNAIRFTPSGGTIAVSVDPAGAGGATITVRDTGVGIPQAAQRILFKRFGHTGNPLHGHRGSGLGLSIAKALVDSMGGRIALASREGQGTTVTITLAA